MRLTPKKNNCFGADSRKQRLQRGLPVKASGWA
jgi:hypothetical protein